ncbi:hypothetical protein SAMN00120144_0751 [Hymenobacter roseosalivarius DSM 11622]|uniref:Uncharacterized protein n=1 Tax=Hymenobacter roseosalivarius DSM 11622 TaxID=645990 RepID=A0A1W1URF8_9BACT|nr:hypothetical protein [Hymenobacter roseosalivarius]SMB83636.1 hypothetical protein SAMN00120144_0751 [Hymenobacter roseosalivarius DSM 11622]
MFRSLFPFQRLLATTFLVVFVNVFVGQCWCATLRPAATAPASAAPAATPAKPTHPGCAGHGKITAKQAPGKATNAHQSSQPAGKHDCCRDKSASVLASLTTPVQKHLLAPAPALLPVAFDYHFRSVAGQWDRTGAVVLVSRQHLPPKIPDIRIYIQSLTV